MKWLVLALLLATMLAGCADTESVVEPNTLMDGAAAASLAVPLGQHLSYNRSEEFTVQIPATEFAPTFEAGSNDVLVDFMPYLPGAGAYKVEFVVEADTNYFLGFHSQKAQGYVFESSGSNGIYTGRMTFQVSPESVVGIRLYPTSFITFNRPVPAPVDATVALNITHLPNLPAGAKIGISSEAGSEISLQFAQSGDVPEFKLLDKNFGAVPGHSPGQLNFSMPPSGLVYLLMDSPLEGIQGNLGTTVRYPIFDSEIVVDSKVSPGSEFSFAGSTQLLPLFANVALYAGSPDQPTINSGNGNYQVDLLADGVSIQSFSEQCSPPEIPLTCSSTIYGSYYRPLGGAPLFRPVAEFALAGTIEGQGDLSLQLVVFGIKS